MKREEMRQWLLGQLELQNKLIIGAAAAMGAIGVITTLMEFGLFFMIIRIGFIKSTVPAFLATTMILAGIQFFTFLRLPKELPDREYECELEDGNITIQVAPAMSIVWTYSFGSLESDQSWVERLLGLLTLPQRMCMAAWYTWQRRDELKKIDTDPVAGVLRLLHKEAARVEIAELILKAKLSDPETTFRHVSLIDGVIFLTRKTCGLSLANRAIDDINQWAAKRVQSPE